MSGMAEMIVYFFLRTQAAASAGGDTEEQDVQVKLHAQTMMSTVMRVQ